MTTSVASFLKLNLRDDTSISPQVVKSLGDLGWEQVHGSYDFVYRWKSDWEKNGKKIPEQSDDIKASVDAALKDSSITYVFKTFQSAEKET